MLQKQALPVREALLEPLVLEAESHHHLCILHGKEKYEDCGIVKYVLAVKSKMHK